MTFCSLTCVRSGPWSRPCSWWRAQERGRRKERDRGQEAYPRVHSDSAPFLANMGSDWLKPAARFL
ncbi:hypothetical protein M9458_020028, partial [Cirrhinus mrigala]